MHTQYVTLFCHCVQEMSCCDRKKQGYKVFAAMAVMVVLWKPGVEDCPPTDELTMAYYWTPCWNNVAYTEWHANMLLIQIFPLESKWENLRATLPITCAYLVFMGFTGRTLAGRLFYVIFCTVSSLGVFFQRLQRHYDLKHMLWSCMNWQHVCVNEYEWAGPMRCAVMNTKSLSPYPHAYLPAFPPCRSFTMSVTTVT